MTCLLYLSCLRGFAMTRQVLPDMKGNSSLLMLWVKIVVQEYL